MSDRPSGLECAAEVALAVLAVVVVFVLAAILPEPGDFPPEDPQ